MISYARHPSVWSELMTAENLKFWIPVVGTIVVVTLGTVALWLLRNLHANLRSDQFRELLYPERSKVALLIRRVVWTGLAALTIVLYTSRR